MTQWKTEPMNRPLVLRAKTINESDTITMDPRCGASPPASACVSSSGEHLQGLAVLGVLSSVPLPELQFLVLH